MGSEQVLENYSWGFWKVWDFVSKRVGTLDMLYVVCTQAGDTVQYAGVSSVLSQEHQIKCRPRSNKR